MYISVAIYNFQTIFYMGKRSIGFEGGYLVSMSKYALTQTHECYQRSSQTFIPMWMHLFHMWIHMAIVEIGVDITEQGRQLHMELIHRRANA